MSGVRPLRGTASVTSRPAVSFGNPEPPVFPPVSVQGCAFTVGAGLLARNKKNKDHHNLTIRSHLDSHVCIFTTGLRLHGGRVPAGADGLGGAPLAAAGGLRRAAHGGVPAAVARRPRVATLAACRRPQADYIIAHE